MSIETTILLENITQEAQSLDLTYSEKQKGVGYYKISDGLHTFTYDLDSFVGVVKLQGTLELYPGDADWVDINDTTVTAGEDSSIVGNTSGNFTGNFVWIRAAYNLQDGTISQIRFNR
jgi:hypothetical protein